jgi:large subunit ribosomal protein L19
MDAIKSLETQYRKPALAQVQSGDTVKVHQLIKEGAKQRTQIFEGVIIRTHRMNELTACITVRRIASGVGVEKTFLLHSPNVSKIEILRRAKVRRNFLSYLRNRRGKSARLKELAFDKIAANDVSIPAPAEDLDSKITEINEIQGSDALDGAVSLNAVENEENREIANEDAAPVEVADEAAAPAEEVEIGLDKAKDGEGKAVAS